MTRQVNIGIGEEDRIAISEGLSRLLADEGVGLRLEEAADAPASHRLVVFAESGSLPSVPAGPAGIRFHRGNSAELADAVQALGALQALGSTALTLLGTDYRTMAAVTASTPLGAGNDTTAALEHYDPRGAYAFADRAQAERAVTLQAQAMEAQRQRWLGRSTVRHFRAGQGFVLRGAPVGGPEGAPDMVLLGVWHAGVNPLPEALESLAEALPTVMAGLPDASWAAVREQAQALGYANAFLAQPRQLPWRPERLKPGQALGYQTARVVGPEGETTPQGMRELHCDALGRVRVRFHWQEEGDSCWLRVAQRYAGPGVGAQFLPRIGQEVLVAFLGDDIDRPVIVGSLYNGRGDPEPGAKGNLTGGAAPAPSLLFSSSRPCGVQKRMRVSTLMISRSRSWPTSVSSQRAGVLPYITCRKPGRSGPRSSACPRTSACATSRATAGSSGGTRRSAPP